jgi:hypothetical protein
MSDYEAHKGKLKPTELTKEDLVKEYLLSYSGTYKWVLNDKKRVQDNKPLPNSTIDEYFYEIEDYAEINGKIYKIQDKIFDDSDDIFEMQENPDGTLEYMVKFYNGGCGFEEALKIASKKL